MMKELGCEKFSSGDCTTNLRVSGGVSYIAVLNPSMLVWLDLQGEQMMFIFTS